MSQISSIDFGLLKFCLAHSDAPNVTETDLSSYNRDPADYVWLREALNNLEGDASKVKKLLEKLTAADITIENIKYALEGIQYYVEDVDVANAVLKFGILQVLSNFLTHPDSQIRMWSAWTVGTICHNNPTAQKIAMEINLLGALVGAFKSETEAEPQAKQITCISAILSQNIPGQNIFLEQYNGTQLLTDLLDATEQSIKTRAMWLVNNIMIESPATKDLFGNNNFIQKLIGNVNSESPNIREKALQTLKTLMMGNKKNQSEAKSSGLDKVILQKLQDLQKAGECDNKDEIDLAKQVYQLLLIGS